MLSSRKTTAGDNTDKGNATDRIEKIFFISGLMCIALGTVVGHLMGNSNSAAPESSMLKLFNVTGISIGVCFAALNLRGWKIIAKTLLRDSSNSVEGSSNGLMRAGYLIMGKLALMFAAIAILIKYGKPLVPSFLTGIAGFFLLGSLLVSVLSSRRQQ